MANLQFPSYGLGFLGAIGGVIVLLNICKWLSENFKIVSDILSYIGRSTLEIMCIHTVDIEAFH